MDTKTLMSLGILVSIAAGAALLFQVTPKSSPPSGTVSNQSDQTIRTLVTNFGATLKSVSLLAPDAATQIEMQYGPYATPELLAAWKADPAQAPGRQTSSPLPGRIDIANVSVDGERATVEGNVIEVTSVGELQPAAVYPIAITLERRGGTWLIASYTRGAYSELPKQVTVIGVWECLPHKDRTGPQTMECAFGILADNGSHYAIDTRLMAEYPVDFSTGTRVRIHGLLTPVEQLSSVQKYDIKGVISATTIEQI